MVLIQATTYKRLIADPEDHWTNVYMLEAANTVAALDLLEPLAQFEADIMGETAEVFKLHCGDLLPNTPGAVRYVNMPGLQPVATPGALLPQWNTMKVVFYNVVGRPEIKYLRLPGYLDMIDGQTWKTAVVTAVSLGYAGHLSNYEFYVGPTGEPHTGYDVSPIVQMRQTNWHRRGRPGFKRGWVPV